jgi:GT2 family glycosyltransferase
VKVFVIVPVHNRIGFTRNCVDDLLNQNFLGELEVIVVDDGSTDGTHECLSAVQSKNTIANRSIRLIRGSGNWWWSKCVEVALDLIRPELVVGDFVIFLNDDVRVKIDYVEKLLAVQQKYGECVVMSQLGDTDDEQIRYVTPVVVSRRKLEIRENSSFVHIDENTAISSVASGRGTLYPARPIVEGMNVDSKRLPHYLSDYEFSARVARQGYQVLCALDAVVYTVADWGNQKRNFGLVRGFLSKSSPYYLRAHWTFWRTWNPDYSRILLLVQLMKHRMVPQLKFRKRGLKLH